MSTITRFPDFGEIILDHKKVFDEHLKLNPSLTSEMTFTNIYAWRMADNYKVATIHDNLVIYKCVNGVESFLEPIGKNRLFDTIHRCFSFLTDRGQKPVIERVGEDILALISDDPSIAWEEDRADFDYVYSVRSLVELAGNEYHDKKNLINQFKKKYSYRYVELTEELIEHAIKFAHEWCEERDCEKVEGLSHENCAILEMLKHFRQLHLKGGAIEVDDKLVALTLGEPLNSDTFVVHVEKARSSMIGLYQLINQEFLSRAAVDFEFVNREQDLGLEGLRRAKLSYNPVRLIKKYKVFPKES